MFYLKRTKFPKFVFNIKEIYKISGTSQQYYYPISKSCQSNHEKSWRHEFWWYRNNNKLLSLAALGIGLVYCESYVNNNKLTEKRFFRAVQYGIEQEVKR